ncbi:MAG: hypothetical protein ACLP2P_04700 [Desulfobaccales bacterium]
MNRLAMTLCLTLSVSACATIEHTTKAEQPVGQQLISGVGDVILRINKKRNLENAFGKADVFGRKTNEGYSEIRFAGVEPNGDVVLYRHDVMIMTNETTMSRTLPFSTSTGSAKSTMSGNYNGATNTGNLNAASQANFSSTTIAPATDYHIVIPAGAIPIRVRAGENRVPIEGYLIEIIKATPISLEYRITKY